MRVVKALPNESTRIADEVSLVIMDLIAELEDGALVNIEVQKMGYLFPGQRSACYSSDLLLRQYRRVRGERRKAFKYRDIHSVYTIVLFEKSASCFHQYPHDYCHYFQQTSDTGLELELLQEYHLLFHTLDIQCIM